MLMTAALDQALAFRTPAAGWIIHGDQGSLFASEHFRGRLLRNMSRRGNCYGNALEFVGLLAVWFARINQQAVDDLLLYSRW